MILTKRFNKTSEMKKEKSSFPYDTIKKKGDEHKFSPRNKKKENKEKDKLKIKEEKGKANEEKKKEKIKKKN